MAVAGTTILGSGIIEAAPIAVKWWLQIAAVSSTAPKAFHLRAPSIRPTLVAAEPSSAPAAIDTMTRTGSQMMRPWISKAAMPV